MPKKQQKNGFFYFMLDYRDRQENLGRRFRGLKDVQEDPKCTEEWKALTLEEKLAYNHRAKNEKTRANKLTGLGELVSELEMKKRAQQQYEANMHKYIINLIKQNDTLGTLDSQSYYLIHVNHYYTKVSLDSTVDYIPAEFAVVEFSLLEGVKRLYHQIIATDIEMGYMRETIQHADATHKIPYDLPESEGDYKTMYDKLVSFLEAGKVGNQLPPLYTCKRMKTIVPCLLDRLARAGRVEIDTFDLYSFEYLFGSMVKHLDPDVPATSNTILLAEVQLDKEAFTWTPDIECFYHLGMEGSGPFCSQSIVTQWVYTFCDYCCLLVHVKMIPGVHCPADTKLPAAEEFASIITSLKSFSIRDDVSVASSYIRRDRFSVANLSIAEQERRKKAAGKQPQLTIIDHSKIQTTSVPIANLVNTIDLGVKVMRPPKTMSKGVADLAPDSDDEEDVDEFFRNREDAQAFDKPKIGRGRGDILKI